MPGIGVINNPKSRQNKKNPEQIPKLGYILGRTGESMATRDFDELEECLEHFKETDIDILAINGGDGSSHVTLSKMLRIYGDKPLPKVALLRGGTLNTVSKSFGIKGKTSYLLYNLAEKYAKGEEYETVEANTIDINGNIGFIFGNGIVANYMNDYYKAKIPNATNGLLLVGKGIFSVLTGTPLAKKWFKRIQAKVTVDDELLSDTTFTSMLAGGTEDIAVGFKPWCRAHDVEGAFHMLFFTCSPFKFLFDLPYIYFARPIHPRTGHEFMVKKSVKIEAEEPFVYTQEGEMYTCESGKMELKVGPRLTMIIK